MKKNESGLTKDEKIWLEESYEVFKKGDAYNPFKIYQENYRKFTKGFFPEDLNNNLVRNDGITLLGIWLIKPKSEYLDYVEKVIQKIKDEISKNPIKSKFILTEFKPKLELSDEELSKVIRLIYSGLNGFIRSHGGSNSIVHDFELDYSFHRVRKYESFFSINDEMEIMKRVWLKYIEEEKPKKLVRTKFPPPKIQEPFEKDTAFIIMQINPEKPELDDVLSSIKEVCKKFNIDAVRADEIEHQDKITEVILNKIDSSEFIIADLSGERPNVYYEIGYAHSKGKRPILIRKKGARLHFDLSVHNVPEYKNNNELKEILMRRFESIMGRKPSDNL